LLLQRQEEVESMEDQSILHRINQLVDEEHALLDETENGVLDPDRHQRLQKVQVTLDQCWDLLRQRRARRDFGEDPDKVEVRDAKTVEGYVQ
jgi:hypothetical protein